MSERLFNHHALPLAVFLISELGGAKLFHCDGEKSRAGGQIEKAISLRVLFFFHLGKQLAQFLVQLGVLKISRSIVKALYKLVPRSLVYFARGIFPNLLRCALPEIFGRELFARDADNRKLLRK